MKTFQKKQIEICGSFGPGRPWPFFFFKNKKTTKVVDACTETQKIQYFCFLIFFVKIFLFSLYFFFDFFNKFTKFWKSVEPSDQGSLARTHFTKKKKPDTHTLHKPPRTQTQPDMDSAAFLNRLLVGQLLLRGLFGVMLRVLLSLCVVLPSLSSFGWGSFLPLPFLLRAVGFSHLFLRGAASLLLLLWVGLLSFSPSVGCCRLSSPHLGGTTLFSRLPLGGVDFMLLCSLGGYLSIVICWVVLLGIPLLVVMRLSLFFRGAASLLHLLRVGLFFFFFACWLLSLSSFGWRCCLSLFSVLVPLLWSCFSPSFGVCCFSSPLIDGSASVTWCCSASFLGWCRVFPSHFCVVPPPLVVPLCDGWCCFVSSFGPGGVAVFPFPLG